MEFLNNSNTNILDLPDEMLLMIFNKWNMVDVLYSLVDVNERFNRLIFDPINIQNFDLTVKDSLSEQISQLDNQEVGKICKKILPRIHHHIQKLAVPSCLIEYIVNIDYSQLQSLLLVNFEQQKLKEYLTGETIIYRLLTNQITHLKIDIHFDKNESNIFLLVLDLGKHLTDLTFHYWFSSEHLGGTTFDLSSRHISSTLTKLIINVTTFNDCLYLLDGSLESLTALTIDIYTIIDINVIINSPIIIDNTRKLFQLKQFSLTSCEEIYFYDDLIIPLLRRMINIEYLTLFLNVVRIDSTYIDGTHLYNDILVFMPQIHKFTFSINTKVINTNTEIMIPSNDDVQRSFIDKGNQRIGLHVNSRPTWMNGQCHVFSLPYQFETYILGTNSFQGDVFNKVRSLIMTDLCSFEYELFGKVSQHFPFLQNLTLVNSVSQKNKQHSSVLITFPHLEQLDITHAHVDYAAQFLSEKTTRLPRLLELRISYKTLAIVTRNFTNDLARLNCSHIRRLVTNDPYGRPKHFHLYFPLIINDSNKMISSNSRVRV